MPATGPEMTRRVLLLVPLAACCRAADPAQEVIDLVADAAASLSAGSVPRFLKAFDPAMEGYAKLRENVTGLRHAGRGAIADRPFGGRRRRSPSNGAAPLDTAPASRRAVRQFHAP